MNQKRRRLLAIVAVVVVAATVGFIVLWKQQQDDLPRLVVLKQEQYKGQEFVGFRFDPPKRTTRAIGWTLSTQNPSTGVERMAMPQVAVDKPYVPIEAVELQNPHVWQFIEHDPLKPEAGKSTEFVVVAPIDDVWRLRCRVDWASTSIMTFLRLKVSVCWQAKSLAPLGWNPRIGVGRWKILESELITNTAPRAAESPRL